MLNFSTLLLRSYLEATGWNEDNLYSNFTRSSSAILDFVVPPSLTLQLANAPTNIFFTSYTLDALPELNGSISYVTSSVPLPKVSRGLDISISSFREANCAPPGQIQPSHVVPLKTMVEHFRVFPPPKRPSPPDEIYLAGQVLTPARDYMLYSRLHLPSLHLSGLASTRLGPTWQASVAFLHQPTLALRSGSSSGNGTSPSASMYASSSSLPASTPTLPPPPPGNLMLTLQRDTGRWSTEYSYSVTDGMFAIKSLYNFGMTEAALRPVEEWMVEKAKVVGTSADRQKRIDEEEAMDSGLRGRFSAGGEIYFSRKQRSLGVSTGIRFTTVPNSPSPPTTLTLLYNPLMGFLSTAYSAQISPHLALSSRYGLNVYSYESDLTIGGEWWIGSGRGKGGWRGLTTGEEEVVDPFAVPPPPPPVAPLQTALVDPNDRDGVLKARVSGTGVSPEYR